MNNFERNVVEDISSIKTETKNCQKACLDRHENLDREVYNMKRDHETLKTQLFDPTDGVITHLTMANVKNGLVTSVAAFFGSAVGMLILGYLFEKATKGH